MCMCIEQRTSAKNFQFLILDKLQLIYAFLYCIVYTLSIGTYYIRTAPHTNAFRHVTRNVNLKTINDSGIHKCAIFSWNVWYFQSYNTHNKYNKNHID